MPTGVYLRTKEHNRKISEATKGHKVYGGFQEGNKIGFRFEKGHKINLGKKRSEETKRKISITTKGRKLSEEHRRNISKGKKGKPSNTKGKHWKVKDTSKMKKRKGDKSPCWKGGKENKKLYVKDWRKKNIDKVRFYNKQNKKRRKNVKGSHTLGEWELLKKQYGYICPACKKKEPEIKLTEDHIIPLDNGGSDNIENIQPLCRSCNSKKHTKIIKY